MAINLPEEALNVLWSKISFQPPCRFSGYTYRLNLQDEDG